MKQLLNYFGRVFALLLTQLVGEADYIPEIVTFHSCVIVVTVIRE